MKNGQIYFFNDVNGLEVLVGALNVREVFVNKSFIKQGYVLVGLSHDMKVRKEVHWNDLKSYVVEDKSLTVPEFTKNYIKEIECVYRFKEKMKVDLSWLEIFQIAAILRTEEDKSNEVIEQIYSEIKGFILFANKML